MVVKVNYHRILKDTLEEIKKKFVSKKPNLLLHSCCGPCSSYVIGYLMEFFNIYIFYCNPNIYPEKEYFKRKEEQLKLLSYTDFKDIKFVDCEYDHLSFLEKVRGYEQSLEGGKRCDICFKVRLQEAVKTAKRLNIDYFSTTLTVSPHKNAEKINTIGKALGNKYFCNYLVSDFKKKDGYKKSIELSKKYNLYRQNYCGCEFSFKKDYILYKKN